MFMSPTLPTHTGPTTAVCHVPREHPAPATGSGRLAARPHPSLAVVLRHARTTANTTGWAKVSAEVKHGKVWGGE